MWSWAIASSGEAGDGREALQLAQLMLPDLVFLDIEMPDMDGLDVLAGIFAAVPRTRVIMVTARADRTTVTNAISYGASGYVLKPFAANTIERAIALACKNDSPSIFASSVTDSLRILILEDDDALLKLYCVRIALWSTPTRIETIADGYEGLLKLRQTNPHLLICDLGIPRVNGFQIVRSLRGIEQYQETKIIVVTGMPPDQIEERGGLPEEIQVLGKPIDFARLEAIATAAWHKISTATIA